MISEGWLADEIRQAVRDITGADMPCRFTYNIEVNAMRFVCGSYVFTVNPERYQAMAISEARHRIMTDVVLPELCPYGY